MHQTTPQYDPGAKQCQKTVFAFEAIIKKKEKRRDTQSVTH
jgi:hypothetical protein